MKTHFIGLSICLLIISGCSTLSKQECKTGDWYGIGLADGAKGRTPSYFSNHISACSEHGVRTNAVAWESGRKQGLHHYCTADNAFYQGEKGNSLSPVCSFKSAFEQNKLLRRNEEGKRLYRLKKQIEKHKKELADIEKKLAESKNKQDFNTSKYHNNDFSKEKTLREKLEELYQQKQQMQ